MGKSVKIGIVGASGLVGQKVLEALHDYKINVEKIVLYGSKKSAGNNLKFNQRNQRIVELIEENLDFDLDIIIFCASKEISKKYSQYFIDKKIYVIDNSSEFRLEKDVPLVVPEVNANDIKKGIYLIANPNCTTIQSVIPLKVIDDLYGIERIDYSTYQAVSGSGVAGLGDLLCETTKCYPYNIKENLIPLIDDICDDKYSKEEHKMINETRKILHNPSIEVSSTCIRVPMKNTHAVNISVRLKCEPDVEVIVDALKKAENVIVKMDEKNNEYPIARQVEGKDIVSVGRIRRDLCNERILHLYCVGDNLRKGAAGNAVQIANYIINNIL